MEQEERSPSSTKIVEDVLGVRVLPLQKLVVSSELQVSVLLFRLSIPTSPFRLSVSPCDV